MRLLALLLPWILAGCATPGPVVEYLYGYEWIVDPTNKTVPCNMRRWLHIPEDQDESGFWYGGRQELVAYVHTGDPEVIVANGKPDCLVISKVSEEASRYFRLPYYIGSIPVPGETVWEHEARHWRDGKLHPTRGRF